MPFADWVEREEREAMGKRGRPPKVLRPDSQNVAGQDAEERQLMPVEDAAHLAHKNARTMMKVMQLMEVMNNPGAEDLDTNRLVQNKIEKYKKRINRRLRKLAEWSDQRVEDRRLYVTDKVKKDRSTYKQVYQGIPRVEREPKVPSYNYEGKMQDPGTTFVSEGSHYSYTSECNKILAQHSETGSKGSTPAGNTSIRFRASEFVAAPGAAPVVAANNPYRDLKAEKGVVSVKPEGFDEIYKYVPEPDLKDLLEDAAKKRRKLDNAHKRSMKELVHKLTDQPPPQWKE